jgi:hypothetical protein
MKRQKGNDGGTPIKTGKRFLEIPESPDLDKASDNQSQLAMSEMDEENKPRILIERIDEDLNSSAIY